MTVEQVIRLLDSGFTRDEIKGMEKLAADSVDPVPEPTSVPVSEPAEDHKPEQASEQKPAAEQKPEPTETEKRLDSIESTMANLLKAVQMQNLKNDSFGSAGKTLEEQTDDIMATIIRGDIARKE